MDVIERRVVTQDWHETDYSKTGWDSYGWRFDDGRYASFEGWDIVQIIHLDKFGNPILAIAERTVSV